MQQNGVFDLLKMLELNIDESFPIIPGRFVVVNPKEIETLIDRIYASLPVEVQEARAFLRRRDEMQMEAQQKRLLLTLNQKLTENFLKLISSRL